MKGEGEGGSLAAGGLEGGRDDAQSDNFGSWARYCTVARVGLPRSLNAREMQTVRIWMTFSRFSVIIDAIKLWVIEFQVFSRELRLLRETQVGRCLPRPPRRPPWLRQQKPLLATRSRLRKYLATILSSRKIPNRRSWTHPNGHYCLKIMISCMSGQATSPPSLLAAAL